MLEIVTVCDVMVRFMGKARRGRNITVPKRDLAEVSAQIIRLKGEVGRGIYQIGRLLNRVDREALWRAGGFVSFEEYLGKDIDVSRASAYRFMRVAEHFNAEIAERYGLSKLVAALRYLAETPVHEQAGDLLATTIRVRGASGRYELLQLHKATAKQILAAVRLLRQSKLAARRAPRAIRRRVDQLTEALPSAPPGTRSGQRVRLLRGEDGNFAVTFQAIPLNDLEAFVDALQTHLADPSTEAGS